jgi:2'-5' RNA ligase
VQLRHRLLFALYPDAETAALIFELTLQLQRLHGLTGRPIAPDVLHITLQSLGEGVEVDRQIIAKARAAASRVQFRAFTVALDHFVSWKGTPQPLVFLGQDGVRGVRDLYGALHAALADVGMPYRCDAGYEPHMTLLRDSVAAPLEPIDRVSWEVRDFALVHSPQGEGRHIILDRWPLVS